MSCGIGRRGGSYLVAVALVWVEKNLKRIASITRPCGDSLNEIFQTEPRHTNYSRNEISVLWSLWGVPYKRAELCWQTQHQTPREKLFEAPQAFVELTVKFT